MALDLYHLNDAQLKNAISSLSDAELQTLEPCLIQLKQRTGITLDSYGTTRLYQNQINMIIQCLRNKKIRDEAKYKNSDRTSIIINKFSAFDNGLIAVGD